jgi:hypothetical protein
MKSIILQTDLDLDGEKYQIKRIKAAEGTYISELLLTKMVPGMVAPLMALGGPGAPIDAPTMQPDEWAFIQRSMLKLISKYEPNSGMPLPLVNNAGVLTDASLEYDTATLMQLVTRAIGFNFSDFFGARGLTLAKVLNNVMGQSSETFLRSTSTSGDQSSPDSGPTPTS